MSDPIHYERLAIWEKIRWLLPSLLVIELEFSPKQLRLIDEHDLYDEHLIYSELYPDLIVRHFVGDPGVQTCFSRAREYQLKGTLTEDHSRALRDLEAFRWKLIRLDRRHERASNKETSVPYQRERRTK
jgi:hypothetical protein